MIQDIFPDRLDNAFRPAVPGPDSPVFCFRDDQLAVRVSADRQSISLPLRQEFREEEGFVYLFSLSSVPCFLLPGGQPRDVDFLSMTEIRRLPLRSNTWIFAVYTAWHLWHWMQTSRFCGACGRPTRFAEDERALICPACGNRIYPRINPAVIVGVTSGDRLLLTRYKTGYGHNALVAGFTEIGETLEETVQREVMEEVGLRVRNIRYYKSQPWGIADDLLAGFFCDVDGDDSIHRDDRELKSAVWTERACIELQPNNYSLTNEMMSVFKDGKIE